MKFLSVLFLLSVFSTGYGSQKKIVHLPPELGRPIMEAVGRCLTETGTNPEVMVQMNENKYKETENSKKFVHCAYEKSGYMNEHGHVKIDKVMELFPNDPEVRPVLEACDKNEGNGPEEKINAFFKCFLEKTPAQIAM